MAIEQGNMRKLEQMGLGPVWSLRAPAAVNRTLRPSQAAQHQEPHPEAEGARPSFPGAVLADAGAVESMDWNTLEATIAQCTRCALCRGRTKAVPGTGDRKARWLFVGEGPGRNEDQQGEPFVGPAGKLLDNMMRALGMTRGENTYIANIVKCRPVGEDGRDRPPAADEVAACMPYLERQIALIEPDVIIALGKTAAVSLLGMSEDTSLSSLRGRAYAHAGIPVVVTYHPAYLLRKPADKGKSWQDLCLAQRVYDGS